MFLISISKERLLSMRSRGLEILMRSEGSWSRRRVPPWDTSGHRDTSISPSLCP